ncbi:hypothetical protein WJX82_008927 [Trebouxia sp. C0006]
MGWFKSLQRASRIHEWLPSVARDADRLAEERSKATGLQLPPPDDARAGVWYTYNDHKGEVAQSALPTNVKLSAYAAKQDSPQSGLGGREAFFQRTHPLLLNEDYRGSNRAERRAKQKEEKAKAAALANAERKKDSRAVAARMTQTQLIEDFSEELAATHRAAEAARETLMKEATGVLETKADQRAQQKATISTLLQRHEEQSGAGALLQPKRSVNKRQSEQRHGQESRNQKKAHSKNGWLTMLPLTRKETVRMNRSKRLPRIRPSSPQMKWLKGLEDHRKSSSGEIACPSQARAPKHIRDVIAANPRNASKLGRLLFFQHREGMGYLIDLHTSAEWRSEHEDDHLHLDEVQEATELYLRIVQEYLVHELPKEGVTLVTGCGCQAQLDRVMARLAALQGGPVSNGGS